MSSDPTPLAESLQRFLAHLGAPPVDVIVQLEKRWGDIIGPVLAKETEPIQLIDGELLVACNDGVWASQVSWSSPQIIERFTQLFPQVEVISVKTRLVSS